MKQRLDIALVERKLTSSRSQAESWIKLGKVTVNGQVILKPGYFVGLNSEIKMNVDVQYVSRAGLKLASVADTFKLDFRGKIVLDVGSSTGGFTDFALRNGASRVYAVDVGTDQLHPNIRSNKNVEVHEKTDIRDFYLKKDLPDIIVIDVSFISLRQILPHICKNLSDDKTQIVAMLKPQFEAGINQTEKGIINKRDSDVAGAKGNQERFYVLKSIKKITYLR
jgi:23S rRNA (cytidine1920-2'-O)/16S rRNA (cytidine1409-2'-O)-methyltransferase